MNINVTRFGRTTGATRDLGNLLKAPLRSAKVATLEAKIGIDHPDQRQIGEVISLGYQLGADNDVDLARIHLVHKFRGLGGRPKRVGCDNGAPCVREQFGDLVSNALDAWTAGHERVFLTALGARLWPRQDMAAMMTLQPRQQSMFDHPCGAVGALEAVPAVPADRQWRITAPVEKQQRLFLAIKHVFQRGHECWCKPASARRDVLGQINGKDRRHLRRPITAGKFQFFVITKGNLLSRLDCGGRASEDDGAPLEPRAHHGDIAGMVVNAVLLFEAGLMRLVNDDQREGAIGQEKRRSRTHGNHRFARPNRPPRAAALRLTQARMPGNRLMAEAQFEPA